MLDFVRFKILPALILLLACLFSIYCGAFPASAVEQGPAGVLLLALLVATILAGIFGGLTYLLLAIAEYEHRTLVACLLGSSMALCSLLGPVNTLLQEHQRAAYLREMAPKVQSFARKYFDQIDTDHDQVITDKEMEQAIAHLPLNDVDRTVLTLMRTEQADLGHVTGSYKTTAPVIISTGKCTVISRITTTHYIYGITRQDLNGYPERVHEKYKKW